MREQTSAGEDAVRQPAHAARDAGRPATRPSLGDARAVLALQRSAGNAAVARALASARTSEGRSLRAVAPDEQIEGRAGHVGAAARLASCVDARSGRTPTTGVLQRLKISQHTFVEGTCGQRNIEWIFALDKPAPEDGYIVQHVEGSEDIAACPGPRSGTMTPTLNFWEAWFVNKGATLEWMGAAGTFAFTDSSVRGPTPSKVGLQSTRGSVKFFGKSTTGDLGKDGVAPTDPTSPWGPGKVPTSAALPSTPTKPAWWDNAPIEGPATREARSDWNCCDADPKKHTSKVTALPVPAPAAPAPAAPASWWEFWKWF